MMTSYRGLEFIDWDGKQADLNHWVRGTCRLGAFPCNGMIYATPHPCSCYISSKLNGFIALTPEAGASSSGADAHPFVRGPAYGENILHSSSITAPTSDWPMYRHDRRRSSSTAASLAPNLTKVWEVDLASSASGRRNSSAPARRTSLSTSCVAVGDTVLMAVPDFHQVVALSAKNGKRIWSFTTGGRIDTPPTIDRGRAYFGCADGWLYCVKVSDGRLWR